MKITYIELNGFKRMALNGINSFKMKITQPLQLILGTNGSGKSSLMDQLTPLPPDQKDFFKTGSKLIHIQHNNNDFIISSTFSPTQKHSFIKNEIELNDGGTITIQRELVKEHFGITPEIHDLIIGKDTFDRMSFSKRKEWFIRLCDTDYEYAIRVYNKIKEKQRDTSGALKLAKKRLVIESEKLVKTDEETKLNEEIKDLYSVLNILMEHRKPLDYDIDVLNLKQQDLDAYLIKYSKSLETIREQLISETLNVEQIESSIKQLDLDIYSLSSQINKLSESFNDNLKKIEILRKAEQATIEDLHKEIIKLINERDKLSSQLLVSDINDPEYSYKAFESVKTTLADIFNSIPANIDKKYSQEKLISAKEELNRINLAKTNLISSISSKSTRLKHMEEHKDKPDLSCPKCNHKFSLHYDEVIYASLQVSISKDEKNLTDLNNNIKQIEEYIETCSNYAILFRQYFQLTNNNSALKPYWDYINSLKIISDNPLSGINELNKIDNDLVKQISLFSLNKIIQEKQMLHSSMKEVGGADLNTLIKQNETISTELEILSNKQISFQNNKKLLQNRKLVIINSNDLISKIQKCILDKKKINKDEIETIRRTYLNDTIRQLQSYLANKENVLHSFSLQKSVVDNIQLQINELDRQEKALTLLVNQLSPTDGLIAEGLLGFISSFVEQMNYFIRKIWSYPLIIKSCSVEENQALDLDYKFPMIVNNDDNVISDISKGSTGMLDIINLAFRITAMQYLNLKQYPLGLDEWGSGFDFTHRSHAVNAIKSLIDQHIFNQLFVISHYSESFGALSNPEICVLDSSNIQIPKSMGDVNKHVTFN